MVWYPPPVYRYTVTMVRCSYWKTTTILSILLATFVLKYLMLRANPATNPGPVILQVSNSSSTLMSFRSTVSSRAQEHLRAERDNILLQVRSSPCDHFEKLGVLPAWTGAKNECIEYTKEFPVLQTVLIRIAKYLAWHEKTRSQLLVPDLQNDSKIQATQLRTLTWRCPRGHLLNCNGYGDRILSMSSGLLYAAYSERYYTIEWPRSYSNSDKVIQVFEPRVLQWDHQLNISSTSERETCGKFLRISANISEILAATFAVGSKYRHVCFNQNRLQFCLGTVALYLGGDVFNTLCKRNNLGHPIRRLINGLLARLLVKFTSEVQYRAHKMAVGMGLQPYHYVAVHIRSGVEENVNVSDFKYKLMTSQIQWRKQLKQAVAVMNYFGLTYPIFLATDAAEVRRWALQHYPGGKVVTPQIKVLHVAKDLATDKDNTYKEIVLQNAAEFALLSRAFVIVESRNSHFSMVASLLGGLPHRTHR